MSWPWIVAAVWTALAVGMTFGWALHGSIGETPTAPVDSERMQWAWPTLANTATSTVFTMTTTGGNEQAPAAGVREPRRPRPQPPYLALVHAYVPPRALQVVE